MGFYCASDRLVRGSKSMQNKLKDISEIAKSKELQSETVEYMIDSSPSKVGIIVSKI